MEVAVTLFKKKDTNFSVAIVRIVYTSDFQPVNRKEYMQRLTLTSFPRFSNKKVKTVNTIAIGCE